MHPRRVHRRITYADVFTSIFRRRDRAVSRMLQNPWWSRRTAYGRQVHRLVDTQPRFVEAVAPPLLRPLLVTAALATSIAARRLQRAYRTHLYHPSHAWHVRRFEQACSPLVEARA